MASRRGRGAPRDSRAKRARSSYDERRDPTLRRALRFFAGLLGLVLLAFVGQLFCLQVIRADELSAMAESRSTDKVTIMARRGTIYDRNGNVLAASEKCSTLYCDQREIENEGQVARILANHLGGEPADYHEALSGDSSFAYVAKRIDSQTAEKILADLSDASLQGIHELSDMRRIYPYGDVAGQVLGIVGDDGQGLTGLELYYDDVLRGVDGERSMEVGKGGTPVAGGAYSETPAQDGTDIVISLDVDVQKSTEEAIAEAPETYGAENSMACIMEPDTGEILALCWTPLLPAGDAQKASTEATNSQMITQIYEPGSVSKVLTAAIGLESGSFAADTTWDVPPTMPSGDGTVSDDDDRGYYMTMNPEEILRRSSNVGAMTEGQAIGEETLWEGLRAFGIGQPTGIDFPGETGGIVRAVDQFDATTLNSMSFGQAYSVPPIQLLRAVAAIGNHGVLVTPHLLVQKGAERVEWPQGQRAVTPAVASSVARWMQTVVDSGTATAAKVDGFSTAGKTGTAQKADTEHGGYLKGEVFSSFVGFTGVPQANLVGYVGVDGGLLHGGDSCAPIFSEIMGEALRSLAITPDQPMTAGEAGDERYGDGYGDEYYDETYYEDESYYDEGSYDEYYEDGASYDESYGDGSEGWE